MERELSCRDFVRFLADYLAGELPAREVAAFNEHLSRCPACVVYLRTYRQAIELGATTLGSDEGSVPADAPEDLVRAVLAARDRTA